MNINAIETKKNPCIVNLHVCLHWRNFVLKYFRERRNSVRRDYVLDSQQKFQLIHTLPIQCEFCSALQGCWIVQIVCCKSYIQTVSLHCELCRVCQERTTLRIVCRKPYIQTVSLRNELGSVSANYDCFRKTFHIRRKRYCCEHSCDSRTHRS